MQGYQRKYLRGLAHKLNAVVQVGQSGVTAAIIEAVDTALLDHELIKVRLREPEEKKSMAEALASGSKSEMCGLVGHTVILYKAHPKDPVIKIPTR